MVCEVPRLCQRQWVLPMDVLKQYKKQSNKNRDDTTNQCPITCCVQRFSCSIFYSRSWGDMLGELLPTSSNCLQGWWSKTNRCNPRVMSFPSVESVVRWVDQESLKKTTPTPLKWLLREMSKNIGHAISFFGDPCDVTVQTKGREPLAPKPCPTKFFFFMFISGHVLFWSI